jgi:hypothetical protein
MALHLRPGMHAHVERLSNGRLRISWRLVGWRSVSTLGAFEGAEREILELVAQWNADLSCAVHFDTGHLG